MALRIGNSSSLKKKHACTRPSQRVQRLSGGLLQPCPCFGMRRVRSGELRTNEQERTVHQVPARHVLEQPELESMRRMSAWIFRRRARHASVSYLSRGQIRAVTQESDVPRVSLSPSSYGAMFLFRDVLRAVSLRALSLTAFLSPDRLDALLDVPRTQVGHPPVRYTLLDAWRR